MIIDICTETSDPHYLIYVKKSKFYKSSYT